MSRIEALLSWLEEKSDWLSPIVVKEVRQVVRGREFAYSFAATLLAGLSIAFLGAADALTGNGTSGNWTFFALMACLAFLGFAVVPLGAFNALRNERIEQTLDLITLTELSPRRIVVGKLLAQGVKLGTLFAAMAPFVAMSFLLGGIDFVTILVSLGVLFMWSLWACALCLFVSTLLKSRALSGIAFGAAAIVLLVVFVMVRMLYMTVVFRSVGGPIGGMGASGAPDFWWILGVGTTFCFATMANLVLLAENRLTLPSENRVTPLRIGFLVQFLLIAAWMLPFVDDPPRVRENTVEALGIIGGLHLALVAWFAVSEELVVPRRALRRMNTRPAWDWLLAMFRPGGGRGALYVLAQIGMLIAVALLFEPESSQLRWLLALCGFICFFSGVPTFAFRFLRPESIATFTLRIVLLVLVVASLVLPDFLYYVVWQPDVLDIRFGRRHLITAFRTLPNWNVVETQGWTAVPFAFGLIGLFTYLGLIQIGARVTQEAAAVDGSRPAAPAGEPDRANVVY